MSEESNGEGFGVTLFSFGFKYGVPGEEATTVLDVRFLPNPYWQEEMRDRNGLEKEVADYVLESEAGHAFFGQLLPMIEFLVQQNRDAGKTEMKIGIGCTGGHHRSVAVVEKLARKLHCDQIALRVYHRDMDKE